MAETSKSNTVVVSRAKTHKNDRIPHLSVAEDDYIRSIDERSCGREKLLALVYVCINRTSWLRVDNCASVDKVKTGNRF